jgi:hypothetical protein
MMYAAAAPPTIHALPPKPVFDHFPNPHTPSPVSISPRPSLDALPAFGGCHYSFCVQLSVAPPPRRDDILFRSANAERDWMHPEGAPPIPRKLPFYTHIVRECQELCHDIVEMPGGCQARVTVSDPQGPTEPIPTNHSFETQRPKSDIVIGIWIAAPDTGAIAKIRSMFLQRCPVQLVRSPV